MVQYDKITCVHLKSFHHSNRRNTGLLYHLSVFERNGAESTRL